MATYTIDWSSDTIGQPPAGWTSRWATSGAATVSSVSGTPNGVAVGFTSNGSGRKFWSFDAAGTPATGQIRALARTNGLLATDAVGTLCGAALNGGGSSGSETALAGALEKVDTSTLTGRARGVFYDAGTPTGTSSTTSDTFLNSWVWIITTYDGTTHTTEVRAVNGDFTEGSVLSTISRTPTASAGSVGIFNVMATSGRRIQVAWMSVGTNGDTAPLYSASTPLLGALSLDDTSVPEDAAATVNILGATATSTIAVQTGSLPTGMTLNSGARTISGTPTTPGTYNFTLRETLAGYGNSPRDTALTITVTTAGVTTTIDNDCDCASVSLSLSSVTNATTGTPTVTIRPRSESWAGQTPSGVNVFLARVKGVVGKTPTIVFPRADRRNPSGDTAFGANYRVVWTSARQPGRVWNDVVPTIDATNISYTFPTALDVDEIIVSTQPVQGTTDFEAMIAELLMDSRWRPGIGADANGVIATSPSETVGGIQVGNSPIYTIVWDDGRAPLDGGPKRVLVMHAHIHAAGEAMSGLRCWGAINWFMNDSSAEADAARRNFILILNGPQCPNGVNAGHNRWTVGRSPINFNRCFTFTGADAPDGNPAEIVAIQANLQTNVLAMGRRIDLNMSWHTVPGTSSGSGIWFRTAEFNAGTRSPIYNQMLTQANARLPDLTLVEGVGATVGTQSNWARIWGNAALAFPCEQGGWGDTRSSVQVTRGAQWMQAAEDMDEGVGNAGVSWFRDWTSGQAVSGVPNLRTRRALADGTHDVTLRATSGADVRTRSFRVTVSGGAIVSVTAL